MSRSALRWTGGGREGGGGPGGGALQHSALWLRFPVPAGRGACAGAHR